MSDQRLEATRETERQRVIAELERLSTECITAFNDHDFDFEKNDQRRELRSRVAPKFQSRVENYPDEALSWEGLIELWRGFAVAEPDCRFSIRGLSTEINPNGTAVLYMDIGVEGKQNLNFARFMEMKWRIIRGQWMYYSCTTMGGQSVDG